MKKAIISGLGILSLALVTGCTTKVYNQTPPAASNTVIERDRPTVVEHHDRPLVVEQRDRTPDVQNNIHVDPR